MFSNMASLCLAVCALAAASSGAEFYRQPAPEITRLLRSPATPAAIVSPSQQHLLLLDVERYPPVAELSRPFLRLAGRRINPRTNGPWRTSWYRGLTLVDLAAGTSRRVSLPSGARAFQIRWSPDGKRFAFALDSGNRIELWIVDANAHARAIPGLNLNAAYGEAFEWMPGGTRILAQTIPGARGPAPDTSAAPTGPLIQESQGKAGPVRTYQDLLAGSADELLFDYYCTAQLVLVDPDAGTWTGVGKPALFRSLEASPDGRRLLVERTVRPYSYLLPESRFPREIEVWDLAGQVERRIASQPLAERIPIDGVATGPRMVRWRPEQPATLFWVEAMDGGNPKEKAPHRDRLMLWQAPFDGEPREFFRVEHRLQAGVRWTAAGQAIIEDYERDSRWLRRFLLDPGPGGMSARLLDSRSSQDRYRDPGDPVPLALPDGRQIVRTEGDWVLLEGAGATPEGERPFLDRMNLRTLEKQRLFQCGPDAYETVVAVLSTGGSRLLTRRETPAQPPNYFLREGNELRALTHFQDPAPRLRGITRQLVTYKRADGVPLSFTLYLPPGYRKGERLPTVVWAYPREYNDPGIAGQIGGSAKRYTSITGASHLFFLLAGYAILDGAALPVVGHPETVNNTYVEQIVAGAKAAVDKAVEMGVADRRRVGVGGHSYGAFMTANLLAHSDLFRAGIARSGAYNRTLTPFGFQNERRTLWEAPETYLRMSPFLSAQQINEPVLFIHGQADDNSGTFPIQSERMYQAVRGNGGTARLVMLPFEAHSYAARESVEHTIWEMIQWFDRHVKNAR
jgi:dipeptidyl aminopeptidase/acylaminoacyl peptidase